MSNSVYESHHETSPHSITKRIGQTTYIIRIHYPDDCKETVSEKLLRIIQADRRNRRSETRPCRIVHASATQPKRSVLPQGDMLRFCVDGFAVNRGDRSRSTYPRRAHGTFGAGKVSEWVRYFEKVPVKTV